MNQILNPSVLGMLVPIIAIIMGIGIAMMGMWLDFRKKREFFELHHKERMAAIEKGIDVPPLPPELFQSNRTRDGSPRGSYLRNGLVLFFVGLTITGALHADGKHGAYYGLIFSAVGLAYLIYYFVGPRLPDSTGSSATTPDHKT